jgi:dihydropteroate synthase
MGICNVTPDSFADGGRHFAPHAARARVDELLAEGADVVDIGGESTRPGAPPVPAKDQLGRVLEVVRYAARDRGALVSIDTTNAEVAAACLDAGACIVNDVSCLRHDGLAKVAAAAGAALVLTHARGTQTEMQGFSVYPDAAYGDVLRNVLVEWAEAAERAAQLGVARDAILMDPGFGFAKNAEQSMTLLRRMVDIVRSVGVPVVCAASRKSFLTAVDSVPPADRLGASIAAALFAVRAGAAVVRVHDVRATKQALELERLLARGTV